MSTINNSSDDGHHEEQNRLEIKKYFALKKRESRIRKKQALEDSSHPKHKSAVTSYLNELEGDRKRKQVKREKWAASVAAPTLEPVAAVAIVAPLLTDAVVPSVELGHPQPPDAAGLDALAPSRPDSLSAKPNLAQRIETALTDAFNLAKQKGKMDEGNIIQPNGDRFLMKMSGFIAEVNDAFVIPDFLELSSMKERLLKCKAFPFVVGSPGRRWMHPEEAAKLLFCNDVADCIRLAFGSTDKPLRSKARPVLLF